MATKKKTPRKSAKKRTTKKVAIAKKRTVKKVTTKKARKWSTARKNTHPIVWALCLLIAIGGPLYVLKDRYWPPILSLVVSDAAEFNDVMIRAKGDAGKEIIDLRINGQKVKSWTLSRSYQNFVYRPSAPVKITDLKVHFTNDKYDRNRKIDYNAVIDYIKVNGKTYQSEASSVVSVGAWGQNGCGKGNKKSQKLNCNGWFDYPVPNGTVVTGVVPSTIKLERNPEVVDLKENSVGINFALNEKVQAQIEYGETKSYGKYTPRESRFDYNAHRQNLTGLKEGTTYNYRVLAKNKKGDTFTSKNYTVTTKGGFGLTANPKVTKTSSSAVEAVFTLSEEAQARIEYGETTSYGKFTPFEKRFYDTHRQPMTGLKANTVYNYRVTATNKKGEKFTSQNYIFNSSTPGDPELPDPPIPKDDGDTGGSDGGNTGGNTGGSTGGGNAGGDNDTGNTGGGSGNPTTPPSNDGSGSGGSLGSVSGEYAPQETFKVNKDQNANAGVLKVGESIREQYGTTTTRVTSKASMGGRRAHHNYSRRSVWNIDESVLKIDSSLVDPKTYKRLGSVPFTSEANWSNTDPAIMYGIRFASGKANSFAKHNIETGSTQNIVTLSNYRACTIGDSEGNISDNDRYVVFSCDNKLISYDIKNKKILGTLNKKSNHNWASVTRSGEYILVENNNGSGTREIRRYKLNFSGDTQLTADRRHGDLGIDKNGDDVIVMISWDHITKIRIKDKKRTTLTKGGNTGHGHISCRNLMRPGYCYASSYSGPIFSVNLESGKVEQMGFTRTTNNSYSSQAKGTASPTGHAVIFTSDWRGKSDVSDYVVSFSKKLAVKPGTGGDTGGGTTGGDTGGNTGGGTDGNTGGGTTGGNTGGNTGDRPTEPNKGPLKFVKPPVEKIEGTQVTFNWTFNKKAQAQIQYGTSAVLTSSFGKRESSFNYAEHNQVLRDFKPNIEYYYRVIGQDADGNTLISQKYRFTTGTLAQTPAKPTPPPSTGGGTGGGDTNPDVVGGGDLGPTPTGKDWPKNASQSLPYGGIFYGWNASGWHTGNSKLAITQSRRFRAERSGNVTAIRFNNRTLSDTNVKGRCISGKPSVWCNCVKAGLDRYTCGYSIGNSYSVGNGGRITVELRNDVGGKPGNTVLAKTAPYVPLDIAGQLYPTMNLTSTANLAAGDIYHLVYVNSNPPSKCKLSGNSLAASKGCPRNQGAIGLNGRAYTTPKGTSDIGKFGPFVSGAGAVLTKKGSNWQEDDNNLSWYELQYADGVWVGDAAIAYFAFIEAHGRGGKKTINGSTIARQKFTVANADRKVNGLWLNLSNKSGADRSPLRATLKDSGGRTLATGSLGASNGCLAEYKIHANNTTCFEWKYTNLSKTVTLKKGSTYTIEYAAGSRGNFFLPTYFPRDYGAGKSNNRNFWNNAQAEISTNGGKSWGQFTGSYYPQRDFGMLFTIEGMPKSLK